MIYSSYPVLDSLLGNNRWFTFLYIVFYFLSVFPLLVYSRIIPIELLQYLAALFIEYTLWFGSICLSTGYTVGVQIGTGLLYICSMGWSFLVLLGQTILQMIQNANSTDSTNHNNNDNNKISNEL